MAMMHARLIYIYIAILQNVYTTMDQLTILGVLALNGIIAT